MEKRGLPQLAQIKGRERVPIQVKEKAEYGIVPWPGCAGLCRPKSHNTVPDSGFLNDLLVLIRLLVLRMCHPLWLSHIHVEGARGLGRMFTADPGITGMNLLCSSYQLTALEQGGGKGVAGSVTFRGGAYIRSALPRCSQRARLTSTSSGRSLLSYGRLKQKCLCAQ